LPDVAEVQRACRRRVAEKSPHFRQERPLAIRSVRAPITPRSKRRTARVAKNLDAAENLDSFRDFRLLTAAMKW
jgi:hypothetical protein